MDVKLAKIYYSPQGYWKGVSAIKKLAEAAKVPENVSKQWLYKQALWEIYLPAPRHVSRPKFDVATPNSVHQADLFLPHDKLPRGKKIYKYALTVVDIANRNQGFSIRDKGTHHERFMPSRRMSNVLTCVRVQCAQ